MLTIWLRRPGYRREASTFGRDKTMLTIEKLRLWESFRGDGDVWGRVNPRLLEGISSDDWRQIDLFVSDLRMMRNVPVAQSFVDDFNRRMTTLVEDDVARNLLRELAERPW
jgi:hypothetical protein